jgi:hypothetical protein
MTNTSDYSVGNQGAAAFRTEINAIFADIQTNNSGASTPSTAATAS